MSRSLFAALTALSLSACSAASTLSPPTAASPSAAAQPQPHRVQHGTPSHGTPNTRPNLFVAGFDGSIIEYEHLGLNAISIPTAGVGGVKNLTADANGNLYATNENGGATLSIPAPHTAARVLPVAGSYAATDTSGDLFTTVTNGFEEFLPGASAPALTTTVPGSPTAIAWGGLNTLFVASGNGNIQFYAGSYSRPFLTVTTAPGFPETMAVSTHSLFVQEATNDFLNHQVLVYEYPYTAPPTVVAQAPFMPDNGMTTDSSGNLYVADFNGEGEVREFAPPYTGSPIAVIPVPIPGAIAVYGNTLYAVTGASGASGTVTAFPLPYNGTSSGSWEAGGDANDIVVTQ